MQHIHVPGNFLADIRTSANTLSENRKITHNQGARFAATPYGTLPVLDPVHTERAIQAALEGGHVYGWEDLAALAGATPEDVMWTCARLHDHNRFTAKINR